MSLFGSASFDYKRYLFLNVTGRNDWTSTIPIERNSFFYPSVSGSFIFSDAFPKIQKYMSGKVRAAFAQVGRDARPYAYRPSLQNKTTTFGGYGYDFWGPNLALKPEFAKSYEFGTELSFLDDRLGVDITYFKKRTEDQIVNDIRGSYGTGYILFNLNGASTENRGWEVMLRGTPLIRRDFSWDGVIEAAEVRQGDGCQDCGAEVSIARGIEIANREKNIDMVIVGNEALYRTEVHHTIVWEKFKAMRQGADIATKMLWG